MTLDRDRLAATDLRPGDRLVWTGQPRPKDFVKTIDRRKDDDTGWWMTDGSGLADYVWNDGTAWQRLDDLLAAAEEAVRLRDAVDRVTAERDALVTLAEALEARGLELAANNAALTDALGEADR